ncbi:hypothetical protein J2754_002064 [Halarchaeum solikamskense]|uniref:hypothetical protein n=1 Tax=Halarchaeum nitratireducens TaxID=489913 RepID=UPI001B3ACB0F|nr:hypothetical protein [Halarchaeum solikamskense]MBP2251732.1 hypothetical protein [Halarchaeum solikamskense]
MSLDGRRSIGVGIALGAGVGVGAGAAAAFLDAADAASAVGVGVALGLGLGVTLGALLVPIARWAVGRADGSTPLLAGGTLCGLGAAGLAWTALDASLVVAGVWTLAGGLLGLLLAAAHRLDGHVTRSGT